MRELLNMHVRGIEDAKDKFNGEIYTQFYAFKKNVLIKAKNLRESPCFPFLAEQEQFELDLTDKNLEEFMSGIEHAVRSMSLISPTDDISYEIDQFRGD